ncbi:tetratricopeptide repeat protein [Roseateles sp.]|uniref:tetratricopeptide repeat protein n=1 Tax=Roseateles sp. TaxID=1971397 RepID=UPI003BABB598
MPSKLNPVTDLRATWLALALAAMPALAQPHRPAPSPPGCGETLNSYGPFDYRTAHPSQRSIVENTHFTHGVETLTRGSTGAFASDIDYTLAVFPNHPRAIMSMERLVEKEKSDPPKGAGMTLECYYGRGMAYAPDDLVFRMFYVSYLTRRNRLEDARRFLDYVVEQAGDNPLTHFNAGMLFFDLKDYDRALAQAHRVMAMGMTRTELRDRLQSVGRWREPEPAAGASAPEAAASAASQTSP